MSKSCRGWRKGVVDRFHGSHIGGLGEGWVSRLESCEGFKMEATTHKSILTWSPKVLLGVEREALLVTVFGKVGTLVLSA